MWTNFYTRHMMRSKRLWVTRKRIQPLGEVMEWDIRFFDVRERVGLPVVHYRSPGILVRMVTIAEMVATEAEMVIIMRCRLVNRFCAASRSPSSWAFALRASFSSRSMRRSASCNSDHRGLSESGVGRLLNMIGLRRMLWRLQTHVH